MNLSEIEGNSTSDHDCHDCEHRTVLFLFAACAVGALVRHALKHTPIPYTVILIVLGLAFGAASTADDLSFLQDFTGMARMSPHLMLYVFLPTLIFESAFVMDVHTFKRTIGQAVILAGPGLILCTFLTSLMGRYIFTYNWTWVTALMFGSICSATDPVAVVALLKELGASKQLGTIIEGESLLNDGAAIVLFHVLLEELIPGHSQTALDIFTYFIKVAFGGPLFGYVMAKVTIFWLSHVFNDALVEITITLVSTYVTFYIGEAFLGVSGVLAVVTLGIEINSRRTNISPEVEVFLHRFWSMLGYLANTLIFILVGVVIAQRAFSGVQDIDWMFMFTLYVGIMVIRLLVIGGLSPLLTKIGYSVDWKQVIVITWGGLRGAVGLALALVVAQTDGVPLDSIGSKVLFHTAGIVILTLLVNATTIKYVLQALGMSDISNARLVTMKMAVRKVREAKSRAVSMLKSDRFLADADWGFVNRKTNIGNPYDSEYDDMKFMENSVVAASGIHSHCPKCETEVPRIPHPKELAELAEAMRMRMIKAEKTSYWRQFEQGMLGRDAVLVLINLADSVMDTPERLIVVEDIAHYWKIPTYLLKLRQRIEASTTWKASDDAPRPTVNFCKIPYTIVTSSIFEWTLFGVILVNVILCIIELSITNKTGLFVLEVLNYIFVVIYVVEASLKMIGLRRYYLLSKWNIFDLIILLVACVDLILELAIPQSTSRFSPAVLRVVRILRILRIGRVLRLVKLALPLVIKMVDAFINRKLRFGYDIGKGYVVGAEEMLQQFDRTGAAVHKSIARELRRRAEVTRLDVIRSLGLMRKEHPGVALSVKTHQAIRSVLNHCRDTIRHLLESGMLDENDSEKLFQAIEVKMKRLERTPASLPPPDPDTILCNLPWMANLGSEALCTVQTHAQLVQFEHGDVMIRQGDQALGIYIIVSGLVKVTMSIDDPASPHGESTAAGNGPGELMAGVSAQTIDDALLAAPSDLPPTQLCQADEPIIVDFFGTGCVMGEMGMLEKKICNATVECETDVQAYFIQRSDLEEMMEIFPVVEAGLWRVSGIRVATQLLTQQPEYQDWPMSKLLLMCEGAYMAAAPDGPVPTFEITDEHKEVVLVSGEVRCLSTRERLTAPCVVPRNVKYLLMTSGSPRLLVIPTSSDSLEGGEAADAQDNDDWGTQQRQNLQTKVKLLVSEVLALLASVPGYLEALPGYWQAFKGYCGRKLRRRVQPAPEEGSSEDGSRTLTPIIRFRSESPLTEA